MYPAIATDFGELRDALEKLSLNDASFDYVADSSDALGLGFPAGFPGPAPHGNYPGTAGVGIQPHARVHDAQRGLSYNRDPWIGHHP